MSAQTEMLQRFVAYLVKRMQEEGVGDRPLETNIGEEEANIGASDRWVVRVRLKGQGVVLSVLDPSNYEWRDRDVRSLADVQASIDALVKYARVALTHLTVHRLEKYRRYRVARSFRDHTGNEFVAGKELVFEGLDYLPHDDGYTLRFAEGNMWLHGGSEEYARFGLLVVPAK
jgi:hypothetical protein